MDKNTNSLVFRRTKPSNLATHYSKRLMVLYSVDSDVDMCELCQVWMSGSSLTWDKHALCTQ